ncbi:nucleotidyl transferase AbiEii/AbiGii toxin family protein [Undibacterium sp. 5I1]|uniref:nucleotidyl transferase AbiEii/AbiGii toxin family protein n=1 Tax=unclassified Undibacterium TaxID=2630295 RepID=UPI002AB4FA2D|nr:MULTISPECIES: nucleotidyl transferase AbiEii/AbiGii toxin family protein [unclassified Undibacterium]MDY7538761.1 nucleotidyl transferase AbiEii/AbiGii toxin family protein [Undibacterium sp. 5I1]MEB0229700.1 nucleotidyl transferase AbiEii/AbiGii toxin family protein [Undibacterium sp. 10I3]MEB0258435.1 nucleotidyl transferase AbiEii/AbiGii toxin family protein [Undibacterium sp. 5I1]
MLDAIYINTVRLLLDVIPDVFVDKLFAIKGGTAINLFVREAPRLSVDIDLVYLNGTQPRDKAFTQISSGLLAIASRLEARGLKAKPVKVGSDPESKLLIMEGTDGLTLKIEVNTVFRGTVLPVRENQSVSDAVIGQFEVQVHAPILDLAELYAGKLVAALDRQHPRDLFDVWLLYQNEGITPELLDCFVVYLAGHNRPTHEVLYGNDQVLDLIYEEQFVGMTEAEPPPLHELIITRSRLRQDIHKLLTPEHRRFLITLAEAEPEWNLLSHPQVQELPALRWKLENLKKFKAAQPGRWAAQLQALRARLLEE